jgi:hypothetical protein
MTLSILGLGCVRIRSSANTPIDRMNLVVDAGNTFVLDFINRQAAIHWGVARGNIVRWRFGFGAGSLHETVSPLRQWIKPCAFAPDDQGDRSQAIASTPKRSNTYQVRIGRSMSINGLRGRRLSCHHTSSSLRVEVTGAVERVAAVALVRLVGKDCRALSANLGKWGFRGGRKEMAQASQRSSKFRSSRDEAGSNGNDLRRG